VDSLEFHLGFGERVILGARRRLLGALLIGLGEEVVAVDLSSS
jgi:hypothetical protein